MLPPEDLASPSSQWISDVKVDFNPEAKQDSGPLLGGSPQSPDHPVLISFVSTEHAVYFWLLFYFQSS